MKGEDLLPWGLQVELASRVEMHEAQIVKLQGALEKADQEKARLEEDLEQAMSAATASKTLSAADQRVSPPSDHRAASPKTCRALTTEREGGGTISSSPC